ncbi:MAG: hypothetical protein ACE5Z5_05430 [Candidatus Bathyarchaeia archaeon]
MDGQTRKIAVQDSVSDLMHELDKVVRALAPWVGESRWSGLGGVTDLRTTLLDSFTLEEGRERLVSALFIEATGLKEGRRIHERFFLPILMTTNRSDIIGYGERMFRVVCSDGEVVVAEGERTPSYNRKMLKTYQEEGRVETEAGNVVNFMLRDGFKVPKNLKGLTSTVLGGADTTNIVVRVDAEGMPPLVVKTYKRITEVNPEPELLEALAGAGFRHVPKLWGRLVYGVPRQEPTVLSVLESFEENDGDGGRPFLDDLVSDLQMLHERCGTTEGASGEYAEGRLRNSTIKDISSHLGGIIAELHHALASYPNEAFEPEPIVEGDVARWSERARQNLEECFKGLSMLLEEPRLEPLFKDVIEALLHEAEDVREEIEEEIARFDMMIGTTKLRTHQDLHLAQMLSKKTDTGFDFILIDFEGDPQRSGAERREKESPLRDLGTMARSFDYVKYFSLARVLEGIPYPQALAMVAHAYMGARGRTPARSMPTDKFDPRVLGCLTGYANQWEGMVEEAMVEGYLERSRMLGSSYLHRDGRFDEGFLKSIIKLWKVEKAILEIRYELNHRVQNVVIPLEGLVSCVYE